MEIQIRDLPETRVAYMRHVGAYGSPEIATLWQRFAGWCQEEGLTPPQRRMYGVSHDGPDAPPDRCRYDACIEVGAGFTPKDGVGVETLAGGSFACTRFHGTPDEVHGAWESFGRQLAAEGYRSPGPPTIEIYEADFAVDPATGAFDCLLCAPIQPR